MRGSLRWFEVTTPRQFREWLGLTDEIYRDGLFVPPVRQRMLRLFLESRRRPSVRTCRFYALVEPDGRLVARTTVHSDPAFDAKMGRRVQLFGFTEFVDDFTVFSRLTDEITRIARQNGRQLLFGPSNLLPNESGGVVISNFEEPSFIDAVYNPPYYPVSYAGAGFGPRFHAATYFCDLKTARAGDAQDLFSFDDRRFALEGLEVHRGDRRGLEEQIVLLHQMLNASFAELAYYTPISLDDLLARMEGLDYLLDEDLLLYVTRFGDPVAFAVCIPDISSFLVGVRGDMTWWNQLRLLLTRRHFRSRAVMLIKGTVPHAQRRGYMTLLARTLYRNLVAKGYRELRVTFVEKINTASADQFLRMGGRVLHDVAFFEKTVAQ